MPDIEATTAEMYLLDPATGTKYYLNGNGTKYTGSGTPWTARSTSPYKMAMNEKGGRYTPQIAQALKQYGGGPPFRAGQTLAYKSYPNVTEPIGLQLYASNVDNALILKQQIDRILNAASGMPCIWAVLPNGSSSPAYFEIYSADIPETPDFINDEAYIGSLSVLRANVTWDRSPFAGMLSAGETAVASATVNNTGTGSPDDDLPLAANLSGDLLAEGQPMNVVFTPTTASREVHVVYLATNFNRAYTTTGATTATTNLAGGIPINSSAIPFDASAAITRKGLSPRCLVQFTALSVAAEVRLRVAYKGGLEFFTGQWTKPAVVLLGSGSMSNVVVDLGTWPMPSGRRANGLAALNFDLYLDVRSTDGSSVTATFSFSELLLYYTFCRIKTLYQTLASQDDLPNTSYLYVDCFQEQTGYPCLPHPNPMAWRVDTSGTVFRMPYTIIGTPPRSFAGASLYACWMSAANALTQPTRATADAATLAARHAPLWRSFRGSD
jgi:hypothetical protein